MAKSTDKLRREIVDRLDISQEYTKMGLYLVGSESIPSWRPCRAIDRDDHNPSAAIYVGNEPHRGQYKDHGGEFQSLSIFDFAAKYGNQLDFNAAFRYYADIAGVKLDASWKPAATKMDRVTWKPWIDILCQSWCLRKKPITVDAVKRAGGKLGSWGKSDQLLIGIPIFGEHFTDADPVGWLCMPRNGRKFAMSRGKGNEHTQAKTITPGYDPIGNEGGRLVRTLVGKYGLDHIKNADVAIKVEGATDLLTMESMIPEDMRGKHVVVTNSSGCGENPTAAKIAPFAGKEVYVIHDADKPGQLGADKWSAAIAKSVFNVQLPYQIEESRGKDLRDYFADGHSYEDFIAMAHASGKPVTPDEEAVADGGEEASSVLLAHNRELLTRAGVTVMGNLAGSDAISLHSEKLKKIMTIADVSRYAYQTMVQHFGESILQEVAQGKPGKDDDRMSTNELQNAIALVAHERIIKQEDIVGPGIWADPSEEGLARGDLILVGSGECARFNGELERLESPQSGDRILNISSGTDWYDHDELAENIKRADHDWSRAVIAELVAIIDRWNWTCQAYDPRIMAGMILASWVQTAWNWRPHVAMEGESHSGKSGLLGAIEAIFAPLCSLSDKSTEAGIRQHACKGAFVIMLDEFEDSKHRPAILEMARASSRGAAVLRGTPSQKDVSYTLRHIFWIASTEAGLIKGPDLNRYIRFEMLPAKPGEFNKLVVPEKSDMRKIGKKLLAIAIRNVQDARSLAKELRKADISGVDARVLENLSVPISMLCTSIGHAEAAEGLLREVIKASPVSNMTLEKDEWMLMEAILAATVRFTSSDNLSVAECLKAMNPEIHNELARNGVGLVHGALKGRPSAHMGAFDSVFLYPAQMKKTILKNDEQFRRTSLRKFLLRIPGARESRRPLAESGGMGIVIPLPSLDRVLSPDRLGNDDGEKYTDTSF